MATTTAPRALAATGDEHPDDLHRVEERVGVYLILSADGQRWEIDPVTLDGYPLDGSDHGPNHDECPVEGCDSTWGQPYPELPTGAEVAALLARAIAENTALPRYREPAIRVGVRCLWSGDRIRPGYETACPDGHAGVGPVYSLDIPED
jgi:hypothetical protein